MVETGKKLGRIPDAFKKTYKSSEALPIKEEPAWSEDDVLRSLEADELEKLETQEEYEAGLRMEAFLRDTVRFNLHEEFDYGLRRPTKGFALFESTEESRNLARLYTQDFFKSKKAVISDGLMDEVVKRGVNMTAEDALLALWNAKPPSDNLFIEWNELTKQFCQKNHFHRRFGECEYVDNDVSYVETPKVGYWIRKIEYVDDLGLKSLGKYDPLSGVYLGDNVYSFDCIYYFKNLDKAQGMADNTINKYASSDKDKLNKLRYVTDRIANQDMRLIVNFDGPFSDDILKEYYLQMKERFSMQVYGNHYDEESIRARMQKILHPHKVKAEDATPTLINVDRLLWGNYWSYHNSRGKHKEDWSELRKHVLFKKGYGHIFNGTLWRDGGVTRDSADFSSMLSFMGDIRFLITILNMWNYERVVSEEVRERGTNKRRMRNLESFPKYEHIVINVALPKDEGVVVYNGVGKGNGEVIPKRFHEVIGHTRRYKTLYNDDGTIKRKAKTVYIKEHSRGDKSVGVIVKSYKLKEDKNELNRT